MTKRPDIDMSPQAVAARLAEVSALYRLTMYLQKFTHAGAVADPSAKR
jgi:hypothetical protein